VGVEEAGERDAAGSLAASAMLLSLTVRDSNRKKRFFKLGVDPGVDPQAWTGKDPLSWCDPNRAGPNRFSSFLSPTKVYIGE